MEDAVANAGGGVLYGEIPISVELSQSNTYTQTYNLGKKCTHGYVKFAGYIATSSSSMTSFESELRSYIKNTYTVSGVKTGATSPSQYATVSIRLDNTDSDESKLILEITPDSITKWTMTKTLQYEFYY